MTTNEPEVGFERLKQPARLVAAHEIATAERDASAARALMHGDAFDKLSRQERIRHRAVHQAFYELVEIQGTAADEADIVLELFAENPEIVNATLKRIEMEGDWSAADPFERDLIGLLWDTGYKGELNRFARQDPEAKISLIIPAGFTKEHGFVALRRTRRLIVAQHNKRDPHKPKRERLEVDKASTFALDIARLARLSDEAAAEVRLIVAATMFKAVGWDALRRGMGEFDPSEIIAQPQFDAGAFGDEDDAFRAAIEDLYNLAGIMRRYDMSIEAVQHQAFDVEKPSQLVGADSLRFIEEAIHERSDLLTPAATTYYAHS